MLSTVCYALNGEVWYALEGAVEVAGAGIEWAKETMNLFSDFSDFDQKVKSVKDDGNIVFVSAFSGLFSPYWRNDVWGALLGLT